ncbi:MAG: NAD(P)-dependent oxidoreductase [Desulfuromonas sp.]|mgnify:CR=1 FL=1|nr:MAG: NAD(P)-dependent oxidoreductase [Desulfuromonas sp.]
MAQTVVITGASSGFGKATARAFAAQGASLVLAARRIDALKTLQDELSPKVPVHIERLDVRERDQVLEVLGGLPEEFAAVDVLVNNAGLALGLGPAWEVDLDDWETMVDTNVKGVMYCTRALLPGMVDRDRGHIVNLGSTAGNWPYPGGNVYGGTKAFVQQFSRNLRADLLGTRVRVTNIEPGMAETEFSTVRFKGDKTQADKVYQGLEPLRGEDIAEIIVWSVQRPAHVNINTLEVMSVHQAWGPYASYREG